jgi:uncharacterized protein
MKYLVLFAVLAIAYFWWRNARIAERGRRDAGAPKVAPPQDMVRCPVCAVHLPRPDAVTGADGLLYCSQEHRLRAGG